MSLDPEIVTHPARSPQVAQALGVRLDHGATRYLSGFVARRSDLGGAVPERAAQVGELLRQALASHPGLSGAVLLPESQLPWSWPGATSLRLQVALKDSTLSTNEIRDALLQALIGEAPSNRGLKVATATALVDVSVMLHSGATLILVAVHGQDTGTDYSDHAQDLVNPQNLQRPLVRHCSALSVGTAEQAAFVVPPHEGQAPPISLYLDIPGKGQFYRHHPDLRYDPTERTLRLSSSIAKQLKPGQRILLGYHLNFVFE